MKIKQCATILSMLLFSIVLTSQADLQQRQWTIDNVPRQALIWMPESTNTPAPPLIFAFHGHGGNMKNAARSFKIHELWPEAVVVYMQGLPTPGKLTDPEGKRNGWNSKPADPTNRDLLFFDAVYASLKQHVDTNRVYSTGHSNGGGFSYCLWAARGHLFAAIAPSSAAFSRKDIALLKPLPVMHIAGETDPLVKYAWQDKAMKVVRKINKCKPTGEPWVSANDLVGTLYPSDLETPFISLIHPGGHKFHKDAPTLIVRFFKEHSRNPD